MQFKPGKNHFLLTISGSSGSSYTDEPLEMNWRGLWSFPVQPVKFVRIVDGKRPWERMDIINT